jgi:hypothetical protein
VISYLVRIDRLRSQVLVSRVTGQVVSVKFDLSGYGVYQDFDRSDLVALQG